jgi:hypothetical protein
MADPESLELVRNLEACEIPAGDFHHEQHVRVAWALLAQGGLLPALQRFPSALRRFAEHHGAHTLYHETITWAFLFLIQEHRQQLDPDHGWEEFARANPELLQDCKGTLARYYSKKRLDSALARSEFVMPDRCPLAATSATEAQP